MITEYQYAITIDKLELGVRICTVLACKKIHTLTDCVETRFFKESRHFRPLFQEGEILQNKMARLIILCYEECYKSLPSSPHNTFDDREERFSELICRELMNAINSSIKLQSQKDDFS